MDKKHEMICDLKRIAVDLGHVPSRRDFRLKTIYPKFWVESVFGGWTPFLHAAGMTPERETKERKKSIFHRDVETVLEEHHAKKANGGVSFEPFKDMLIIGDTHFPWVDVNALSAVYQVASDLRPKIIVQVGDLYDFFAHSSFPRTHNEYTPEQEITIGFQMASDMWRKLREICPGAECYQIHGNHTTRPIKRLLSVYPEGEIFFSIDRFFDFAGVTMIKDPREELVIQGISIIHGHLGKLGDHRDYLLKNVICGHSHVGGVSFRNIGGKTLYEANAGFIGDQFAKALSYTPVRATKWTLGCLFVNRFGPMFIPFG